MNRYKIISFFLLLFVPCFLFGETDYQKQKKNQKDAVSSQKNTAKKDRDQVKKKIRSFLADINGMLDGKELILPVDPDKAEDADENSDFHDGSGDEQKENTGKKESGTLPAKGKISGRFGTRTDPFSGKKKFHKGIDIAAPKGTPVYASASGKIICCEYKKNGYGNLIVIDHGDDLFTCYGHLNTINVKKGQIIKQGSKIGTVGSTGRSTGPHLHFEVRKGEQLIDPEQYLKTDMDCSGKNRI